MFIELKEGSVLFVEGSAAVIVSAGLVSILGADVSTRKRVIVRRGKTLPIQALRDSTLEIIEGEGSTSAELLESTIPESWTKVVNEVSSSGFSPVVVLGDVDLGKNTFCIYLSNLVTKMGGSVALIEGDVSHGDIGPPACVSMALVSNPLLDFFSLKPEAVAFVGCITPIGVQPRILDGLSILKELAAEKRPSLILVNTDGWVLGDEAAEYKLSLLSSIAPQGVIGIQARNELEPILSVAEFKGFRVFRVEPSGVVRLRDRETRKSLREQCYRKFLSGAVSRSYPLNHVKLGNTFLNSPEVDDFFRDRLSEMLGHPVLAYSALDGGLHVLVKGIERIDESLIAKASLEIGRPIRVVVEDEVKGLILGMFDEKGQFLGLGIFNRLDFEHHALGVLTPIIGVPSIIRFGRIRLDESFREIGFTQAYEP